MRCAILVILATVLLAASAAYAATPRLEAEGFTPPNLGGTTFVNDANASGSQALKFTASNRLASQAYTLNDPATAVTIRARGVAARSKFASIRVHIDGKSATEAVLTQHVNTPGYTRYRASIDLPAGTHTVYLRCMGGAASAEPNDADCTSTRNLIVDWVQFTYTTPDTIPPDTSITAGPSGLTANNSPSWSFSGTDNVGVDHFECRLDGVHYGICTSPKSYTNLANGSHTFSVRAIDAGGNVDGSAATRDFSVSVPANSYSGMRFYQMAGWQPWPNQVLTAQTVDDAYNTYWKPAYSGNGDVYFTVRNNLRWADVLVNERTVPTHAQMRNPNWSGYKWNQLGGDEVDNMLGADCVTQGKCKVSVMLATSATAGDSTPQFMVDLGLGWVGAKSLRHTSFHKPEAVQYASEFILAYLDHIGNDPRIGSVKLGEYYPGPVKPADWNRLAFEKGYKQLLQNVSSGAPRDASGKRVTIYQSNPIISPRTLECPDLSAMKIGVATSDPRMFETGAEVKACRDSLHGIVPMGMPGDAGDFSASDPNHYTTYDGTPNPWGYNAGQTVAKSVPQAFWFYGHAGPIPMDQEAVLTGTLFASDFQNAMDRFGPGGTYRSQRPGGVPYPN